MYGHSGHLENVPFQFSLVLRGVPSVIFFPRNNQQNEINAPNILDLVV